MSLLKSYLEEGVSVVLADERSAPTLIPPGNCFFCLNDAIKQCPMNPNHKVCETCFEKIEYAVKANYEKFRFPDYKRAPDQTHAVSMANRAYKYIMYGLFSGQIFKQVNAGQAGYPSKTFSAQTTWKYIVDPYITYSTSICCCLCDETFAIPGEQFRSKLSEKRGVYVDIPVGTMNEKGSSVGGKAFMCYKCKAAVDRIVSFYGLQKASVGYVESYGCPKCGQAYPVNANEDNARTEILSLKPKTEWICTTCYFDVHGDYAMINGKHSYNKRFQYVPCTNCSTQKSVDLMTVPQLEALREFKCESCMPEKLEANHSIYKQDDLYIYHIEMMQSLENTAEWLYVIHRARRPSDSSPPKDKSLLSWKIVRTSEVQGKYCDVLWEAYEDLKSGKLNGK